MPWGDKKICVHCDEEFTLTRTKPGFANECGDCGQLTEDQKGNTRPGGVVEYECKTNGVMKVVSSLATAKQIKHSTNRHGQGRPLGMYRGQK